MQLQKAAVYNYSSWCDCYQKRGGFLRLIPLRVLTTDALVAAEAARKATLIIVVNLRVVVLAWVETESLRLR